MRGIATQGLTPTSFAPIRTLFFIPSLILFSIIRMNCGYPLISIYYVSKGLMLGDCSGTVIIGEGHSVNDIAQSVSQDDYIICAC